MKSYIDAFEQVRLILIQLSSDDFFFIIFIETETFINLGLIHNYVLSFEVK